MAKPYGFGKKERLKSRKQIESLFATGKSLSVFPLRAIYQLLPVDENTIPVLQTGVSISKRYFKKAVDRNRIKRLMREAYRLQKTELRQLMDQKNKTGYLFFIYTDKTIVSFSVVKEAMRQCLQRLQQKVIKLNEDPA